jgi:hypothetical protein
MPTDQRVTGLQVLKFLKMERDDISAGMDSELQGMGDVDDDVDFM